MEVNFDGLVGPTHNYAGLSDDNRASSRHAASSSSPRAAALQGLSKMKALADLGLPQAILPPLERPSLPWLRHWGIEGKNPAAVFQRALQTAPRLLRSAASASSMWTANAATVTPSSDTRDGRLHLTPANLLSKLHRSIEAGETTAILGRIFQDENRFSVHSPLGGGWEMSDEGAANHTRLTPAHRHPGLHLFVYGRSPGHDLSGTRKFLPRQSGLASRTIARIHQLNAKQTVFLRQRRTAIDAGVFHNDVIAVGNLDFYFCHELAYENQPTALDLLRKTYRTLTGEALRIWQVRESDVPLADAVSSYLFNSQLLRIAGKTLLLLPTEARENERVFHYIHRILEDSDCPIEEALFIDLRESMKNGGGPACLRLRVVLTPEEQAATGGRLFLDEALYQDLTGWVKRHYRETLLPEDLADPALHEESLTALDELTAILRLGSLYPFQQSS